MELTRTLSQSGALYLANRKTTQRRSEAFRNFAAAARIEPTDVRRRTFADSHVSRRFHPDNGR
jgi:hypothetical protein